MDDFLVFQGIFFLLNIEIFKPILSFFLIFKWDFYWKWHFRINSW